MLAARSAVIRLVAALAVALVPLVGIQGTAGAVDGRCAPGDGVTVVVDYGRLRSGIDFFCDRDGGGKTVSAVMAAAGVDWQYTSGQPFVCRIEGLPGPERESCSDTPPANAYWGLFWSDSSPRWTYASQGATSQRVPNGGSVGWRFQSDGETDVPGAAPTAPKQKSASAPAPKPSSTPKPSPTPKPTPKPSPTKPARVTPPATQSPSSSASSAESATAAAGGAKSSPPKPTAKDESKPAKQRRDDERRGRGERPQQEAQEEQESVSTSADEVYEVNEPVTEPVTPVSASGGDGAPATVVALLLLAGLGTAAALVARRRRAS